METYVFAMHDALTNPALRRTRLWLLMEADVLLIDDLIFSTSIPEDAGEVLQSIRW